MGAVKRGEGRASRAVLLAVLTGAALGVVASVAYVAQGAAREPAPRGDRRQTRVAMQLSRKAGPSLLFAPLRDRLAARRVLLGASLLLVHGDAWAFRVIVLRFEVCCVRLQDQDRSMLEKERDEYKVRVWQAPAEAFQLSTGRAGA